MEPWQFLRLAQRLVAKTGDAASHPSGSGGVAADLRTSISRCYYAAFLTARSFLIELGYQVTKLGASHEVVRRALIKSGDRDLTRVASNYAILGEYRRKADYDLENDEVEELERAEEMTKLCEKAISLVGLTDIRLSNDEAAKKRLIEAIDAWLANEGETHIWKGSHT